MIEHYLESLMGEGTPHHTNKGMQYSYKCPICDDYKERFFVNIDRKVCYCHNCEYKGSIITFISDFNSVSWQDALDVFREYEGYDFVLPEDIEQEIYDKLYNTVTTEIPKIAHPLPEEFQLVEDLTGKTRNKVLKYLKSRGVTLDMAERYYIGYCSEGKYEDRIIMTDFENSDLVYWQARTILPTPKNPILKKAFRKVLNPSLTQEQLESGVRAIDKSDVVSNIDFILEEGIAVLCEGRMDSYTIGDTGACIHGKSISDTQFMKLVMNKNKIDLVVVMFDGDAFNKSLVTADRLYKHFDDVLVTKLPKDADPNSLGRKKVIEHINEAIPYSPMFNVKARLKGWV